MQQDMAALTAWADENQRAMDEIASRHPEIAGTIAGMVMGNDLASMWRARRAVQAGEFSANDSITLVGSFARWDYAFDLWGEGAITDAQYFGRIADLWRGSDPDDMDPRWSAVWDRARTHFGGTINDNPAKRLAITKDLTVYRGQPVPGMAGEGLSWTTSREIARKFALGAAVREPLAMGWLLTASVDTRDVFAYLTMRNEYEVVIDPSNVIVKDTVVVKR